MQTTELLREIGSDGHLPALHAEASAKEAGKRAPAEKNRYANAGKRTRMKVAIIYALTTIIPLLAMLYIIQANVFLRNRMDVTLMSFLALIALGIALLGGKLLREPWGKLGQALETIENLRTESHPLKDVSELETTDEIDRIPTVVSHLVDIAKKQMSELKSYNEQVQLLNEKLREANEQLHHLSREDALTGLHNRRYFDDRVSHEIARTRRFGRDLALAMIDIDFFKHYNDNIGHPAGDKVLATIGEIIRTSVRETDLAFRYGGEEFAIVLPETTAESATSVAERIRSAVERHPFHDESSQPNGALTVSIGVSVLGNDCDGAEEFISAADKALYKAKSIGRNRVVSLSAD